MKREKRVHGKGSKQGVNTQSKTAPGGPSVVISKPENALQSFPWCFSKAAFVLAQMITDEEARREKAREDNTRLRIMRDAVGGLIEQGTGLLCDVPPGGVRASYMVKPFGPIEPTHEVEMARYHIWDVWKIALTMKSHDALGGHLPALNNCIQHHPGLRAESAALAAMSAGSNELTGLSNAERSREWDGRKLSGAELWFAGKLNRYTDRPLADYLALLEDAKVIFNHEPGLTKVAASIGKILHCRDTVMLMRRWSEAL